MRSVLLVITVILVIFGALRFLRHQTTSPPTPPTETLITKPTDNGDSVVPKSSQKGITAKSVPISATKYKISPRCQTVWNRIQALELSPSLKPDLTTLVGCESLSTDVPELLKKAHTQFKEACLQEKALASELQRQTCLLSLDYYQTAFRAEEKWAIPTAQLNDKKDLWNRLRFLDSNDFQGQQAIADRMLELNPEDLGANKISLFSSVVKRLGPNTQPSPEQLEAIKDKVEKLETAQGGSNPDTLQVRLNIASRQGDLAEMRQLVKEEEQIPQMRSKAIYDQANIEYLSGNTEQMFARLEEAQKADPKNIFIADTIRKLKKLPRAVLQNRDPQNKPRIFMFLYSPVFPEADRN